LLDPFCSSASGAKYPDDSSAKTLPYKIHFERVVTSTATGEAAFLVFPQVDSSPIVTPSLIVGDICTYAGTPPAEVPLPTGATSFRIVSVGIKLKSIAPFLTASGMVNYRSFAALNGSTLGTVDGNTYLCSQSKNVALVDLKDECCILEHTSQRPAEFYTPAVQNPTGLVPDMISSGYAPLSVFASGLPVSTPVIHVEYVMHVEYLFDDTAALALAATPPPPSNALVTQAAAKISSLGESVFHHSVEAFGQWIERKALTAVGSLLGSPGAAATLAIV